MEDDKAEWVPYQQILKFKGILSNISTLNSESDHGNDNGGDEYFWDKDLEDASPLRDSTQLISKFEDILPNSSPLISFETNQHHDVVGDHHGNSNANGESFSWYIDLEDDKAQCVPNHNDGERDIWNKDLEDGKALCVATQLGSKSEDILFKSLPLSFESNNHRHAVDGEHGNNNGDNGIFSTKDLEDANAQCVSNQLISKSEDILSISTLSSESNHQLVVDDHHGNNNNGGEGSLWDEVLEHAKEVNNINNPNGRFSYSRGVLLSNLDHDVSSNVFFLPST